MNGVHDMGGLQDMGPVRYEKDEPVFHAPWEGRVYAIDRSLRFIGKWNVDAWRHQIELLPPADYLRMTYYERWLRVNEQLAVKHGLITQQELEAGAPDPGSAKATPALTAAIADPLLGRGLPSSVDPTVPPQFKVGQQRTRPQHESGRAHAAPSLCARQAGHRHARPRRVRLSRHERALPRRKAPARLLSSFFSAGTLGC